MNEFRLFSARSLRGLLIALCFLPVGGAMAQVPLHFPGHFAIPVSGGTFAAVVGDIDHDGQSELLVGRGSEFLSVVEFEPGWPFRRSGTYSVGGRVTGIMMLPDGPSGLGRIGVLLDGPDRFVVLRYLGTGIGFSELAAVALPEDPGEFKLIESGPGDAVTVIVALPGIDSWIHISGSESDWTAGPVLACGDSPGNIVDLDIEDDGEFEIVLADTGVLSKTLSVFEQDGEDGYVLREQISLTDRPTGLAACDQDGDSRDELYVSYLDSTFISVFSASGGTLVETERIPVETTLDGVVAAPLGGGETALWCWQTSNGMIHYFRRTGGVWVEGEHFFAGGHAVDVEMYDINHDGSTDLIVPGGISGKVAVLFGNEQPSLRAYFATSFPGGPWPGAVCDENDDGHLDLILPACDAGTVEFLYGDGLGHLERRGTPISVESAPVLVSMIYANSDTLQDLAVLTPFGAGVEIWCKVTSGEYLRSDEIPISWNSTIMHVSDMDADGAEDLIIGNSTADEVLIAWSEGDGSFTEPLVISMPQGLGEVIPIQLDGDDQVDLVASTAGPAVGRIRNLGNRTFGTYAGIGVGSNTRQLAVADLDEDGDEDVVVVTENGTEICYIRNVGDGSLELLETSITLSETCGAIIASDLNLDGNTDLVVTRPSAGGVTILFGTGQSFLAVIDPFDLAELPLGVRIGDFDEDGRPDMVVMDNELGIVVMGLNVDPAPVAAEVFALSADCLGDEVGVFFAVPADGAWSLSAVADGESVLLADETGLRCGRIAGAGLERTLYVTVADLTLVGLGDALVSAETLEFHIRTGEDSASQRELRTEVLASCFRGDRLPGAGFQLDDPQPNPFNPRVSIGFTLGRPADVEAVVWDLAGRRVATLADRAFSSGWHELQWDGRSGDRTVGAGTYVVTVSADGNVSSRKMTLLK